MALIFDRDYQQRLVARLLDAKFLKKVWHVLTPGLFDEDLDQVAQAIIKCYKKYDKIPTKSQLKRQLDKDLPYLPDVKTGSMDYDIEEIERFMKFRVWRDTLLQCHEFLNEEDYGAIAAELDKVRRSSSLMHAGILEVNDLKDGTLNVKRKRPIFTGLDCIDELMGGTCLGETSLVMAPTSCGKSSWMISVGSRAVMNERNVLHCSLEMNESSVLEKYQVPLEKWMKRKHKRGRLTLLCASPYTLTPVALKEKILQLRVRPDLLIIDSLDLLKSSRRFDSRWEEDEQTAVEVAALTKELDCATWISCQANRPGYGGKMGLDKIKGSLARVQLPDQVLAIQWHEVESIPDSETGIVMVRFILLKNRYGPRSMELPIDVDFVKCDFQLSPIG